MQIMINLRYLYMGGYASSLIMRVDDGALL